MKQTLSKEELDERVAVLRRFRALLEEQRNKFREYLTVLESQQNTIEKEDTASLLAHTELEQEIVANIASLQKVVVPMEELYKSIGAQSSGPAVQAAETADAAAGDADAIPRLQADLANLQNMVLAQNEKNRSALKVHISSIKAQLASMQQNPYRTRTNVYAAAEKTGHLVAVNA